MTFVWGGSSGRLLLSAVIGVSLLTYLLLFSGSNHQAFRQITSLSFATTHSSSSSSYEEDSLYIWQIRFSPDEKSEERRRAWIDLNPNRTYVFLDQEAGNKLVNENFRNRPDIQQVWQNLGSRIFRSDYLRYLALAAHGGVYADLDAVPVKAIDKWIPDQFRGRARAVIGLEFDQRGVSDPANHGSMEWNGMDWPVQFCQWTIYSPAAKHPLLQAMVDQVTKDLIDLAQQHGKSINDMEPTDTEVTRTTGPSAWTRLIFKQLSYMMHEDITWQNVTGITEPRLFGDVLIMPINAFGAGQEHSGSSREQAVPDALIRHLFEGFWKHGWNN